jgi:general secretion pathway protein K
MSRPERVRQRGFALLLVLLALGMLSLVTARLLADGRSAVRVAGELRDSAAAEAAADGALQQAIFQLHRGAWAAGGAPHLLRVGRATVVVSVADQRGRINPNRSGGALLAALLVDAGSQPARAMELASAIMDWRTATAFSVAGGQKIDLYRAAGLPYGPPDRPFTSVDEISEVPGMTPALLERLRPFLSVYQSGAPVVAGDAGAVRAALQTAEMIGGAPTPTDAGTADRVVELHAVAALPGGTRFTRVAIVRLAAGAGQAARGWQILNWH